MKVSVSILAVLLSSCVLGAPDERAGAGVQKGFTQTEPVVDLNSDPRFVLRERFAGSYGQLDDVRFGHRSRQWHVYPVTLYPRTQLDVSIHVDDARMADKSGLWLFGPMKADGSWGEPQRVPSQAGIAQLSFRPQGFGQYAVVVGPATPQDFLPRYPGRYGVVRDASTLERMPAQFPIRDDRTEIYVNDGTANGTTYTVESPLPANAKGQDAAPGALFRVRGADGSSKSFELVSWTAVDNYLPEGAVDASDAVLGILEGGVLTLDPDDPTAERRYLVLTAIGSDGEPSTNSSTNPAFLQVVPEKDGNRAIELRSAPGCSDWSCRTPVYVDDGSAVSHDLVTSFKPVAVDFEEPSTYDLKAEVRSDVAAGAVGRAYEESSPVTRHPIYFAHGFNSSEETWEDVLATLRAENSRWEQWAGAGSVPGFRPVPERAEHLRRNLTRFVEGFAPESGEPYVRINVVAHSMGGLDTRYLTGTEKYNERCGELLCTGEDGTPEACCPADENGNPVMWRDRIVSVTTLSTPHHGSGFADWGANLLEHRIIDWAFEKLVSHVFHLDTSDPDAYQGLKDTMVALSRDHAERETIPNQPLLNEGRAYDWACATGQEDCDVPATAAADRPRAEGEGFLLPAPNARPTFFSWAAVSCTTGICGDLLDPQLVLPHAKEGKLNDGIVAVDSAQFGIYMGVRSNDHFHWTRTTYSTVTGLGQHIFGFHPEPIDRWHMYWIGELAAAGY